MISKPKNKNYDGTHLSQASNRADELKQMLIESIEKMDENEVEIMKSAIDSVKDGGKKIKKRHHMNTQSKPTLKEIKEEGNDEEEKSKFDINELELEAKDEVKDLQLNGDSPNKAAVPPIKDSRMSMRSSRSSVFIAKLQAEIEEERKEREKLQKEMDEMKRLSSELLSQLNSKQN